MTVREAKSINDDEIVAMMLRYGGSFIKALGEAYLRADQRNRARIKIAFPDYWDQYRKVVQEVTSGGH